MKILMSIIAFICVICFAISVWANSESNIPDEIPKVFISPNKQNELSTSQSSVITATQIKQSGATNISQILLGQGGVQLQDVTGDGSQVAVSIRGFGDNAGANSLILIDGVPLINPDIEVFNLNSIPIEEVDKIELSQSSEGVLYGDQAVGGVVNIVTKKPLPQHISAKIDYGSFNTKDAMATLSNIFNNGFSFRFFGKKKTTDNYREHNNDDESNLNGQMNYQYRTGLISLDYYYYGQHLLYAGALTLNQLLQNRRQAQNNLNFNNQTTNFIHLHNLQILNTHWAIKTDVSTRKENDRGFLFCPFQQARKITVFSPHLEGALGNVAVITGINYSFDDYQLLGTPSQSRDQQGISSEYANFVIPFSPKFSFTVGARNAEMKDKLNEPATNNKITSNNAFVTSAGISYQPTSQFQCYLRRDGNYRFPKADEIAFTSLATNGLKTQTGVSYEAGAKYFLNSWQIDANVYQLDLRNEIAFDPTQLPTQPFGANTNLDPTRRRGVIFSGTYLINDTILVGGQYSHFNAKLISGPSAGNQIPFVSPNILRLTTDLFFTPQWDLFAEMVYTSSRYALGDIANSAAKVPAFTICNLNLSYHKERFTASLRINNITNIHYSLITSADPNTNSEYFYPAPGRNYLFSIGYQLS